MKLEGKILGELKLRQVLTLGVGAGISYAIYAWLEPMYYYQIWLFPTLIPITLALLLAFIEPARIKKAIRFRFLKKPPFSAILKRLTRTKVRK